MRRKTSLLLVTAALAIAPTACKKAVAKTSGVGDNLQAFIIQNCETGKKYCQVCKYSGQPTIMAVGDLDDAAFNDDLARIQKLVDAGKEKGLTAFAVVGQIGDGQIKPFADEKKAMAQIDATRAKLGLSFPIVIVPKEVSASQKRFYLPFNDAYAIKGSRTILVAGADNKVVHADVITKDKADAQYGALEQALKKVL